MEDSEHSTSACLSPEARRIIQEMSQEFEKRFAQQQQLIEYVFNKSGIPMPTLDSQSPQQSQPAPQSQPTQQDQPAQNGHPTQQNENEELDDGNIGDHRHHVYKEGY